MTVLSIGIRRHRAFSDVGGFSDLSQINVLVGRNNAGKSSLLDAIAFLCDRDSVQIARGSAQGELLIESEWTEEALKKRFLESTSHGPISGNHWQYGKQWVGETVVWSIGHDGRRKLVEMRPPIESKPGANHGQVRQMFESAVGHLAEPFAGKKLLRVLSDRDIRPEGDLELGIEPDGRGATTAIRSFLTEASLDRSLVARSMLHGLNQIFAPDTTFEEIYIQRLSDGRWEVFLAAAESDLVPLSASGSGLRTVLLVLAQLHLTPAIEGRKLEQYVLAFEELENNLHPALQRRLMAYIRSFVVDLDLTAFITTHSHSVIDLFATDGLATITHVINDGLTASTRQVVGYGERSAVLDDLDVRASDLLQANGVIWVEGPSDRIYVNRWIEVVTGGKLREGTHYQCVFFGGSLLAHLTAGPPQDFEKEESVELLRVNRNAALLLDSDRAAPSDALGETKEQILHEIENVGGLAWVTAGREVENYLSSKSVGALLDTDAPEVSKYEYFDRYLDRIREGQGRAFLRRKALFAAKIAPLIDSSAMGKYDLADRVASLAAEVVRWNRM